MPSIMYACLGKGIKRYKETFSKLDKYISEDGNNKIIQIGGNNYHFSSIQLDEKARCRTISEDNITVLFSGRIYGSNYIKCKDETKLISDAYRRDGETFANSLSGPFVAVIYDHIHNKFIVANDVFGLLPCYYYQTDDVLFFTTEAEALVKCGLVKPELNSDSLADLYVNGSITGKYTLLNALCRFLPATVMTMSQNGAVKWSRNDKWLPRNSVSLNQKTLAKDVDALIGSSITKIITYVDDANLEIKLSGGLDSRLMLMHAVQMDRPFKAVTDYDPNNTSKEDVEYAKSFAKQHNLHHEVRTAKPEDGLKYRQLLNNIFLHDKPVMTGHWAEIIKGKPLKYQRLFNEKESYERLHKLFTPDFISKLTKSPYQLLVEANGEMLGCNDSTNLYLQYIFQITSYFRLDVPCIHRFCNRFKTSTHLPFLDKDLLLFIINIPPDLLEGSSFFINMVKELYPYLLDIPTTTLDRMDQKIDRIYKKIITPSQQAMIKHYKLLKKISPFWKIDIFSDKFETREEYIATALLNIWYDYYFYNKKAAEIIKTS